MVLFVFSAMAQDDSAFVNKRGISVLPQAGDIAIGIDAAAPLQYIGNAFNGNVGNNAPNANFLTNNLGNNIYLKYFIADDAALRLNFAFNKTKNFDTRYVTDDAAFMADPLTNDKVMDMQIRNRNSFILGAGFEKRKGRNRVQGFYGAGTYFTYTKNGNKYEYGNAITEANPIPSSSGVWGNVAANQRTLSEITTSNYGFGLNAFIGVEYFIFPSVAIGAELGYGYALTKNRQTSHVYEYWNNTQIDNMTVLDNSPASFNFIGVVNPTTNFYLMFNF